MAKYIYPALFTPAETSGFYVTFPDIENCFTDGDNLIEAMEMAQDVLACMLCCMERDNDPIPQATPIKKIKTAENEFATLILCDTTDYPLIECEGTTRIRETRTKANMTIKELAKRSGIAADVIERIEATERSTISEAIKLSDALGVEFKEICIPDDKDDYNEE